MNIQEFNAMTDEQIGYLLGLNEDDLFFETGKKLGFEPLGLNKINEKTSTVFHARHWFQENKKRIKHEICISKNLKLILSHETPVAIIRVLADIIFHELVGIPPFEISVIILNAGVKNICNEK